MKKRQQHTQHRDKGRHPYRLAQCLATTFLVVVALVFWAPVTGWAGGGKGLEQPPPAPPLAQVMKQLNLTPEQQDKLRPIVESDREKHLVVVEKFRMQREAGREAMQGELAAIDKKTETKLAEVLNAEQMTQYSKLRAEWEERMCKRRPPLSPLVRVMDQLTLTPGQRAAIQPIIQADRDRHRAIMEKSHDSHESLQGELAAIDKKTETKLAEVLTAEQMTRYYELRDELRKKMPARGEHRGGRYGQGLMRQRQS